MRKEQIKDSVVWATYMYPEHKDKVSPRATQSFLLVVQYPTNFVHVKDFTLKVDHPMPCTQHYHPWYEGQTTSMNHLLFLMWGQGCEAKITNIRAVGKEVGDIWADPPGDKSLTANGKNLIYPIIVGFTMGDTLIKNCELGHAGGAVLEVFGSQKDSAVVIENNDMYQTDSGIFGGTFGGQADMSDVTYFISRNRISGSVGGAADASWEGIGIYNPDGGISDVTVVRNTITGFPEGVWVQDMSKGTVSKNTFIDVTGELAAIFVKRSENVKILVNDYRDSGLPGWTPETPDGPGCVLLDAETHDNLVVEYRFPPGTTLTDQVCDNGVDNQVHGRRGPPR